jgi:hypothetical protein
MAIASEPETKSPFEGPEDLTSKVTEDEDPVFALAVTVIAPSDAAIDGVISGSELGKVRVVAEIVNFALVETVAVTVKLLLSEAARALPAIISKTRLKIENKLAFTIVFIFSFSNIIRWPKKDLDVIPATLFIPLPLGESLLLRLLAYLLS